MDPQGISGRQFASELASLKARVDKLEKAKRNRVGNAGGSQAMLINPGTIDVNSMIHPSDLARIPYNPKDAIEILWNVVKFKKF